MDNILIKECLRNVFEKIIDSIVDGEYIEMKFKSLEDLINACREAEKIDESYSLSHNLDRVDGYYYLSLEQEKFENWLIKKILKKS